MAQPRTDLAYRVREVENLWVPLPDGTRLAARAWLPEGAGPVPAVIEYLPYRKRDGTRGRDGGLHGYLAGHGYACLRLDIRGTGDSEGLLHDEYSEQEQIDGCDAIAWIAAQDWCDGQVATIGISWGGFNGLQIAARRPPALRTVITVGSTDDRYATDIHWVGGCLSKDNFDWSATMLSMMDLPPDPAVVGDAWRATWEARREANAPWILTWLGHQTRDAYWRQGSACEDFSRIEVPVYAVSGWADNYSESVPRLLAGLAVPRLGLVGPWAHSYPHDAAVEPSIGWLQEAVRWCDHWMKGRDTGMMDGPIYRAWMQDSVPPLTCHRERPGRWVAEQSWPSPGIEPRTLALSADGRLGGSARGARGICSPLWVGLGAGEVGRYGDDAEWPGDQREDDGGSLVWVSDPLPDRLEILGAPQVRLRLSADRPRALVACRLNEVLPDGRVARVGIGLLNLMHRDGFDRADPLEPGTAYDVIVEMDDVAHSFPPGHRLAVSLSTTYWPIAWPSPELATVTVHDGVLVLPVRPPRPQDDSLAPFGPPEAAPHSPVTSHPVESPHRRRVTRDLLSGLMTVDFPRWTYRKTFDDIGVTHASEALARYEIADGDPLSARCLTHYRTSIERPDATIEHESHGELACDATHFRVRVELVLREDGQEAFRRSWDRRILRETC